MPTIDEEEDEVEKELRVHVFQGVYPYRPYSPSVYSIGTAR
jgi:hypothetical protein